MPTGAGPLELAKLFCQREEINFKEVTMVSPDGRSIMYLQGGTDYSVEGKVLHVARLDAHDSWSSYVLNMGALWQFGQAVGSIPAYGWAADSGGIWTATREKIGPGGIRSSGLQPIFISLEDGSTRLFDPPRRRDLISTIDRHPRFSLNHCGKLPNHIFRTQGFQMDDDIGETRHQ